MTSDDAIQVLRAAEPTLRGRYGVVSARLFGSVARNNMGRDSDVDVAIQFAEGQELDVMKLCGVSGLLSALLRADVDVVVRPASDPNLNLSIDRDGIIAF